MIQYIKNIWAGLSSSFIGMKITWKHLFVKKVTIQYPDQRFTLPEKARNRLYLEMSKCNGCNSCAIACPVNCITVETIRVSPNDPQQEVHFNGKDRKLWVSRYEIDFAKCCYCGLCTAACPSDAINHTTEYEYSEYKRENLVYKFQTLTPEQVIEKERLLAEFRTQEKVCHPETDKKPADNKTADKTTE
ncbi:MAG: NADH-quinone oxidoreductase subunit I [Bacteroidales bacterium]|nr:NADH-quinone oxidoreductase subunit I [Bacteroidales bacterium]